MGGVFRRRWRRRARPHVVLGRSAPTVLDLAVATAGWSGRPPPIQFVYSPQSRQWVWTGAPGVASQRVALAAAAARWVPGVPQISATVLLAVLAWAWEGLPFSFAGGGIVTLARAAWRWSGRGTRSGFRGVGTLFGMVSGLIRGMVAAPVEPERDE